MQAGGQTPVFVMSAYECIISASDNLYCSHLDTAPERQSGRKAQISNITAAKVAYTGSSLYAHTMAKVGVRQSQMLSEHVWDLRRC
jgi:hypothetical protein